MTGNILPSWTTENLPPMDAARTLHSPAPFDVQKVTGLSEERIIQIHLKTLRHFNLFDTGFDTYHLVFFVERHVTAECIYMYLLSQKEMGLAAPSTELYW
jgi:hypothetical protein